MSGAVVILTGAPGAGKTTVARRLADDAPEATVHLHTDDFFTALGRGLIPPWAPESREQNVVISKAIAAAAGAFACGGYPVIVDGIVGPWHLDIYRREARRLDLDLHYVVLRLSRDQAVRRARERDVAALPDYPPRIFDGFTDLAELEAHAIELGDLDAGGVVAAVRDGLTVGRFRLAL